MIRVLIADDEELVRTGLRLILDPLEDIEVVGEAGDGHEALRRAAEDRPDVVLMDVRMPRLDGLAALQGISRLENPPQVVVLTTFDLDDHVHLALRSGAAGFLLKATPPRELAHAVRAVAAGNVMLASTVTKLIVTAYAARRPAKAREARERLAGLTDREGAVTRALARGLSNAEIGRALRLTETTVKAHISCSLTKLNLTNRVQLAILVHDAGLADEGAPGDG
ncbi:response regulator [Streptomyces asiaticus]